MITFFLMNFIVVSSAFLLTFRVLKIKGAIDSLLALFIIYFGQIIITETILGVFNILFLGNVILFNLLILFIIWLFTRNQHGALLSFKDIKNAIIEFLSNKIILLAVSVILGFALVKICINLINPPFGWDCLNYHFVFPVEWLKHGNLDTPITISDAPSPTYYPINGSLLFLWLIFPFRNVMMADLGQLPFYIIAFFSCYSIARKLGLSKEFSMYASILFTIIPNYFKQLEIGYIDIMVATIFWVCLNYVINLYKDFSFKNILLSGIALGLFIGLKQTAIIFALPLVSLLIIVCIKHLKTQKIKKVLFYLLIFFLATAILGGYTYIRDFLVTNNPLYPTEIKIFGKILFKGPLPVSTYSNRWTKEEFNLDKFLFHEGMGIQFLFLLFPAIFLAFPIFLFKKKFNPLLIFLSVVPLILYISFWLFMPLLWVRYLYPLLGIGFVIVFYILYLLKIPNKIIQWIVAICLLASIVELAGHTELIVSLILSFLFFGFLPFLLRLKFKLKQITVFFLMILIVFKYININYNRYEFTRYLSRSYFPYEEREAWKWLDDNTQKARIAYVGRPDVLPLYGTNFKNDVFYISVNKIHPVKLHYFPNARYVWTKDFLTLHKNLESEGNYRENPDYFLWLKNLHSENIDYLLVYSLHQVRETIFPIEDIWADKHPAIFNLVFKNELVHIYKIIK